MTYERWPREGYTIDDLQMYCLVGTAQLFAAMQSKFSDHQLHYWAIDMSKSSGPTNVLF